MYLDYEKQYEKNLINGYFADYTIPSFSLILILSLSVQRYRYAYQLLVKVYPQNRAQLLFLYLISICTFHSKLILGDNFHKMVFYFQNAPEYRSSIFLNHRYEQFRPSVLDYRIYLTNPVPRSS